MQLWAPRNRIPGAHFPCSTNFGATLPLERVMLWTALNGENENRRSHTNAWAGAMSEIERYYAN